MVLVVVVVVLFFFKVDLVGLNKSSRFDTKKKWGEGEWGISVVFFQ